MEQSIEECGDCGGVAEELAPIVDGPIRREDRRGAFVAAHDQLEQIFGSGVRELAHAEVVHDEQRDGGEVSEVLLARAVEGSVGELFDEAAGRDPRREQRPSARS